MKKKNKTDPIGVRFDIEILEKIKQEQELESPQKVLNWLLENYGSATTWNNRMSGITEAIKNTPLPMITSTNTEIKLNIAEMVRASEEKRKQKLK